MRIHSFTLAHVTFAAAVVLLASLIGCSNSSNGNSGGQTPTQPAITSVAVSCSPTTIQVGQTSKCTATVGGTGNFSSAVTWSVDNGTLDQSGDYTAPSGATTATVKATSNQDTTKSGTATVTVNGKVGLSITPTSAQVQVFHSQQFTATVPVTWAVNNILGGNLTVGQIDSTGFYLAPNTLPSPSAITVTATSQADATQSASASVTVLSDATAPTIVSTMPAAGATNVALDSTIQIQFSDSLDPATVNAATFALSTSATQVASSVTYDPTSNTVTITAAGMFAPGIQYTATVSNLVADPAGRTLASSSQYSFTTQPASTAAGIVSDPSVPDPTTLTVVSYGGQENAPDNQGNFTASVIPLGSNLVAAMVPGKSFGWFAFAADQSQGTNANAIRHLRNALDSKTPRSGQRPVHITRYQVTASPRAASSPDVITVDAHTTAESLLFMTPYLYHPDPTRAAVIQAAIAGDQNTAALTQALEAAAGEADPLSDPTVQSDLQAAIISITTSLNASSGQQISTEGEKSVGKPGRPKNTSPKSAAAPLDTNSLLTDSATPNCWTWTPDHITDVAAGQLQCLDLEYVTLQPASQAENGAYAVTLNNNSCPGNVGELPFGLYSGCDIDSLAIAGPINPAVLPPSGPSAIAPGQGSNGPSSPAGDMLSCGLSSGILNSNCSLLYLQGNSAFSALDPSVGFGIIVQADLQQFGLNISSEAPVVPTFQMPSASGTTYVLRDYSGGSADALEQQNLFLPFPGTYGSYSPSLWVAALSMNLSHIVIDAPEILSSGDPPTVNQCAWQTMGNLGELGALAKQALSQDFSTPSDALASATSDANTLKQYYVSAAKQCVADDVIGAVWDAAAKVNPWSAAINAALDKLATAGEVGQRMYELRYTASPVETGIVTVTSPFGSAPLVAALNPTTITGLDGNQLVQIEGTGFISGAQAHWELADGTDKGTTLSSTFSPTAIGMEQNFGNQTASWQVQIINPGGKASNWWPFQVTASSSDLPAPALLTPANGATGVSTTPAFSWSAVTGNAGYRILVAPSASGLPTDPSSDSCPTCVIDQTTSGTSYTASTALSGGTVYYWEVHALTPPSNPGYGTWSSIFSFTTSGSSNLPAPTLLTPANGATGVSTTPAFSWSAVTGNAGYRILVAPSASGLPTDPSSDSCPTCVIDQTTSGTSYTASTALSGGTVYYWEVHALTPPSNPGYGTWSSIFSFTTSGSSNLPAPTLLTPANGATGVSTTPAFSWSAVTGNAGYRILVAPSASGLPTDPSSDSCPTCVIDQTTSGTSYTASTALSGGTVYYWEVHALTPPSNPGYGTWSSIFSFTTSGSSNLPAPTLLTPANGATGVSTTPAFSWSAVTGNAGYRILVAPSASGLPTDPSSDSCPTCVIDQTTSGTSYTASTALSGGTVYYWEVHALTPPSNPGYGTWSSIFSFTTSGSSNLPAPTLLTPANGATGVSTTPAFSWSAVTGNAGYRILVAPSASGLPTDPSSDSCPTCVIDQTTSGTSYTASTALSGGTVYYWEVHALTPPSNPGYGTWSSIFSFTTSGFYIGEYVMVSGTGGEGLNLRSCAETSCSVLVDMPDGTVMQVVGGPTAADGYTWWNLSGTVSGVGYMAWAIQDYLVPD